MAVTDSWLRYCVRWDVSDRIRDDAADMIRRAVEDALERAALLAEQWGALAPVHQQTALAEAIRALKMEDHP